MIVQCVPVVEEIGGERLDLKRLSLSETEAEKADFTLASDATDLDIFPGNLTTVDILVLTVNGGITFKANSSSTAQTLDANGVLIWWGTALTALTVTEPNSAAVRLRAWFWGA